MVPQCVLVGPALKPSHVRPGLMVGEETRGKRPAILEEKTVYVRSKDGVHGGVGGVASRT